ncbi:cytochrome P450 [Nocardia seriolae]|nr:cytochrome P450 [Nocardia seriolae]MTJ66989.1 cytochrome P450 [Nocardia seriolae]MTJ76083.1 cytochrome P450 [Nocardia seriolae]MTJ84969.1 cytochrome P450 [Nocardia seriolae]MTK28965.1 cytochrome P450 [Nocardia seriolae]MTK44845.1 cytochrome P450 [Nocardia seriolae]
MSTDLMELYARWRRKRDGDPFRAHIPGLGSVLFTGTPEGVREIFRAPIELLEPPLPNPIEPMVGAASLILARDGRHRRERALLAPALHRNRISAYGTAIRAAARAELDGERTGNPWRPGLRVDARAAARALTLRVILAAVFGIDEPARRAEYTAFTTEFLESFGTALFLLPVLRRNMLRLSGWERFEAARDRLDELIDAEVARRRAAGGGGADLLGLLLGTRYEDGSAITATDLREQLRTLLVAGHETTATALVWALYRLHREPAALARLLDELSSAGTDPDPDVLVKLPYLDAVCQETLRLHPPVPIVLRRLTGDFTLRGVPLVAGDTMGISIQLLHSDPAVWPQPHRFRPERFLERRYGPFEFAPFGGGHRRCVGAALADYELRIVLATVLTDVRLRLSPRFARGGAPLTVPHTIAVGPRTAITFDVQP